MIIEVFPETDSADGSGWTYGTFYCPHREDVDLDWSIDCIGGYSDPFELIGHVQTVHS